MANRRIEMFEYRQIIHRMRSGESDRTISKSGLIGRAKSKWIRVIAKINGWLNLEQPIPNEEDIATSVAQHSNNNTKKIANVVEPFAEQINTWLNQGASAKVIYNALVERCNFNNSYHVVARYIKKIKEAKTLCEDITIPLIFTPGEAVQIDFGQGPKIFDERSNKETSSWIFVMTLCYSRHQYAEIIKHQDCVTWLSCHKRGFEFFGGVVKKAIIDNAKCAITKACFYEPTVQRSYGQLAEDYGFIISACPPFQPQKKGIVENGVSYVKSSFLPLRNFKNFQDANAQLKEWILGTAGNRNHGTIRKKPLVVFNEIEKNLLKPLPIVPPEFCVWHKAKCYRDCCVRFENSRYSVPYQFFKQELWIKATESMIKIYHDYKLIAAHTRSHSSGETIVLVEHFPPNAKAFLIQDQDWCIENAKNIGPYCLQAVEYLLSDKQCDYLRAVQGIIKLKKKFGADKLELASKKALDNGTCSYKVIKEILFKKIESPSADNSLNNKLDKAYLGEGKFYKKIEEFLFH